MMKNLPKCVLAIAFLQSSQSSTTPRILILLQQKKQYQLEPQIHRNSSPDTWLGQHPFKKKEANSIVLDRKRNRLCVMERYCGPFGQISSVKRFFVSYYAFECRSFTEDRAKFRFSTWSTRISRLVKCAHFRPSKYFIKWASQNRSYEGSHNWGS